MIGFILCVFAIVSIALGITWAITKNEFVGLAFSICLLVAVLCAGFGYACSGYDYILVRRM